MKAKKIGISVKFVNIIPTNKELLDENVFYINEDENICFHLCPCGCGDLVTITIYRPDNPKKYGWEFYVDPRGLTLYPSIQLVSVRCKSHYIVKNNEVRLFI